MVGSDKILVLNVTWHTLHGRVNVKCQAVFFLAGETLKCMSDINRTQGTAKGYLETSVLQYQRANKSC